MKIINGFSLGHALYSALLPGRMEGEKKMEQKLFRKESLDRMSSPEQLNQYIRVTNPSIWLILAAVIVLLAAAGVWGITGRLETALPIKAVVRDHEMLCFLTEEEYAQVKEGMTIRVNGVSGVLPPLPKAPASYDSLRKDIAEYDLQAAGVTEGGWYYPVRTAVDAPDGICDARIVIDSVSPFSFLTN